MDDLSVGLSVGACVGWSVPFGLSSALWKNIGSDPNGVWHHRSDRSTDEAGSGVWQSGPREGVLLGASFGARQRYTYNGRLIENRMAYQMVATPVTLNDLD